MEVLVLKRFNYYHDFIGEIVKLDNEGYHVANEDRHYFQNENNYINIEHLEDIKKMFNDVNTKQKDILNKYDISINDFKIIKKYLGLSKKPKLKKFKINIKNRTPRSVKIKVNTDIKKEKKCVRIEDMINVEEFKKDYVKMSNKELENKYNKTKVTLWYWAKKFNVKRPDRYYSDFNIKHNNNWSKEDEIVLLEWCDDVSLSKEYLTSRLDKSWESCKSKMRALNVKHKKREKAFMSKVKIETIKNESRNYTKKEIAKKYNITTWQFKKYLKGVEFKRYNINEDLIKKR